jgi:O-antigen ligase
VKASSAGLIVLFAIVPFYGTLAVFDPSRPPIPPLVPAAVALALGVITLSALVAVVPAAARSARRDWLTIALVVPGLTLLVSALAGFDPVTGAGLSIIVLGCGAAGLALARDADAVTTARCVRAFLWSGTLASLLALAMVVARRPAGLYAYNQGRAVGTFLNPNELAAYLLIGLGIALPIAVAGRGRDRLAVAAAAVFAVTLAATFSRWGAFSAVCGAATYALFTRTRALLVAALAVAIAGIGIDVLAGAQHHNPRDTEARAVAWRAGLTTFARFPLLGVGPLAFGRTYDEMRPPEAPGPHTPVAFDPHSLPIATAAEGGILTLIMLAFSPLTVELQVLRAARAAAGVPRALAFGIAAGFVALLIDCGINTIALFFPLFLTVVPLGIAVSRTDAG